MKKLFFLASLFLPLTAICQNTEKNDCELNAINYFFNHVLIAEPINTKKMVFSGLTEPYVFNFGLFRPCFQIDLNLISSQSGPSYMHRKRGETIAITPSTQIALTKRYSKKYPAINLYNFVKIDTSSIVPVVVTTHKRQSICYYFTMDNFCHVVSYCKVSTVQ